ncbi:putative ribosome bioproteinis GTPase RsgA [Flavobacteriaceae bacterium UJ101]|nr:putative ribosome bioproteinis GTPase RsgA [Flavobacteriaceae bacterium UJ101]
MTGTVTKSTGSWYSIRDEKGKIHEARIKGKFRIQGIKNTNPIAVGDIVDFEINENESTVITKIHERKNYIIRKSVNLSKKTHIIASNIDIAFLIITLKQPQTSTGFIDRFLVTAEAYSIPVILLFNKVDTLSQEEHQQKDKWMTLYQSIGYPCQEISALNKTNVDWVQKQMKGKTSMLSGHSGAGKSTLINALDSNLNLKTKEVSHSHNKGQHTTTFAEMFEWPFGGYIIDTPGIKGLGLVEMEKEEIGDYFPEILNIKSNCKFNNCLHLDEPKCAVKTAVEQGEIATSRFASYISFLEEDAEENYRQDYW